MTLSEVAQLRLPAAMIPGELVHKNNCATGAGLLVMQPHAVVGGGKGHLVILSGTGVHQPGGTEAAVDVERVPVHVRLSSEARKSAASAISSGVP